MLNKNLTALKAELLLLLITLVWGATFTFTKLGFQDSSVFFYIFIRFCLAFIFTFIFWGRHLFTISKENLKNGMMLGFLFACGFATQTLGLNYTTATKSAFITGMAVVLTPLAYKIVIKRKINLWQQVGIIITFLGLWLFSNPKTDNINIGDLLTLISTFFWAFYLTYMDVFTKDIKTFDKTIQLVFLQFIFAIAAGLIGTLFFDRGQFRFHLTGNLALSLIYNGIIASVFLTIIHTSVQKFTTPIKAALIFSLEPVFAAIIAILALNEMMNHREINGASILLAGVIISELGEYTFDKIKSFALKIKK